MTQTWGPCCTAAAVAVVVEELKWVLVVPAVTAVQVATEQETVDVVEEIITL